RHQRPDRRDVRRPAGRRPRPDGSDGRAAGPLDARGRRPGRSAGVTRSPWLGRLVPLTSSLLAIVAAFVVGALFLAQRGRAPLAAYDILFRRGLGTSYGVTETLIQMAPLLIVSAGLLISLRAGVWNIGIDGQLLVGALLSAIAASALVGKAPNPVMWLVA